MTHPTEAERSSKEVQQSEHTPGNWHIDQSDEVYVQIPHPAAEGGSYAIRCIPEWTETADQQDYANARLIAAAPNLLAACRSIFANFHENVTRIESLDDFPALKAVADAIEKATGQELKNAA